MGNEYSFTGIRRSTPVQTQYAAIKRKQGGTLDYKHYFDFFNNTFN